MLSLLILVDVFVGCVVGQGIIPGVDDDCFLPLDVGPCRAFFPEYYHNAAKGTCECFAYGGCEGNRNRFRTLQDCMETCNVNPKKQDLFLDCESTIVTPGFQSAILQQPFGGGLPQQHLQPQNVILQAPERLPNAILGGGQRQHTATGTPFTFTSATPRPLSPTQPPIPGTIHLGPPQAPSPLSPVGQPQNERTVSSVIHRPGSTSQGTLTIGQSVIIPAILRGSTAN